VIQVRKATKKVEKQPPKEGVPKAGRARMRLKYKKYHGPNAAPAKKGRK
jgi:hypothetical protein